MTPFMRQTLHLLAALLLSAVDLSRAADPLTDSVSMRLMPIQPGTFNMGQGGPRTDYRMWHHPGESNRSDRDEQSVQQVCISKPFHLRETGNGMIRTRNGVLMITQDLGVSLSTSSGKGRTCRATGAPLSGDQIRPGGKRSRHAGIHASLVELADGRFMVFGRSHPAAQLAVFHRKVPLSFNSDEGRSWTNMESEFPAIPSVQRPVIIRLRHGLLLLCSFTDPWSQFYRGNRKGTGFRSQEGEFTGYGLFAAVSPDEGLTWPGRRLITPGGPSREAGRMDNRAFTLSGTLAEPRGYHVITQTRDNRLHLLTSGNHYTFNLPWIKQLPPLPNQDENTALASK